MVKSVRYVHLVPTCDDGFRVAKLALALACGAYCAQEIASRSSELLDAVVARVDHKKLTLVDVHTRWIDHLARTSPSLANLHLFPSLAIDEVDAMAPCLSHCDGSAGQRPSVGQMCLSVTTPGWKPTTSACALC